MIIDDEEERNISHCIYLCYLHELLFAFILQPSLAERLTNNVRVTAGVADLVCVQSTELGDQTGEWVLPVHDG